MYEFRRGQGAVLVQAMWDSFAREPLASIPKAWFWCPDRHGGKSVRREITPKKCGTEEEFQRLTINTLECFMPPRPRFCRIVVKQLRQPSAFICLLRTIKSSKIKQSKKNVSFKILTIILSCNFEAMGFSCVKPVVNNTWWVFFALHYALPVCCGWWELKGQEQPMER